MTINPQLFKQLFGVDFHDALVKYSKTVGSEHRSRFKQLFTRNHVNVVLMPVFVGDAAVKPILDALSKELLLSREGTEIELQPLLNPTDHHNELIANFKGFIPEDDHDALRISLSIIELEDSGFTSRSDAIQKKLVRRYEARGKHIYNLCRSGFIDWLHIRLGMLKFEYYGGLQKARQEFLPIWNEWMNYCKIGVFINEHVGETDFVSEMNDRFHVHNMQEVYAFARGEGNVARLREWAETYCTMRSGFKTARPETYKIGDNKAIKVTFQRTPPRLGSPKKTRKKRP